MIGKSTFKVVGGKLLRAEVDYEAGVIRRVKLSGDFFIHPEDAITEIEKSLAGCELDEVAEKVDNAAARAGAQLIGFTPKDVAEAVRLAMEAPAQ